MEFFKNEQVFPEDIPTASEINFLGLDKKHVYQMQIAAGFFSIALFVGLILLLTANDVLFNLKYLGGALISWLILVVSFFVLARVLFRKKGYALREKDIHYKTGWIFKKVVSIPYSRIQHCEVTRGITDQLFDLSKLNVYTAGGGSSDITIPGLTDENAENLKRFVLRKTADDAEE